MKNIDDAIARLDFIARHADRGLAPYVRGFVGADELLDQGWVEVRKGGNRQRNQLTLHPTDAGRQALVAMGYAEEIFGNKLGQLACAAHAPVRGSDTWKRDGWRARSHDDLAAFTAATGVTIHCERCRADNAAAELADVPPTATWTTKKGDDR